jgi:hypothetical protein
VRSYRISKLLAVRGDRDHRTDEISIVLIVGSSNNIIGSKGQVIKIEKDSNSLTA